MTDYGPLPEHYAELKGTDTGSLWFKPNVPIDTLEPKAMYTADQMRAYAAQAVAAERERCAKLCEPTGPRPCDCERCDCGNATDARMVAEWDEAAAMARRIRGA